eukprot:551895-Amphidinium_carterae.1
MLCQAPKGRLESCEAARTNLQQYLSAVQALAPDLVDTDGDILRSYSCEATGLEVANALDSMLSDTRARLAIERLAEDGVLGAKTPQRIAAKSSWTKSLCTAK